MIANVIEKCGVMPIVNTADYKNAGKLARTMMSAGVTVCEVVFRNSSVGHVLEEICSACPDMLVGAGTILTEEQADLAKERGARFAVSPGLDRDLAQYCLNAGILPIPGVATASEVQLAVRLGLKTLKLFPAGLVGGLDAINALAAPFASVRYIPTNGVGLYNMREYLQNPHVLACGGTFPCPPERIVAEDWDGIADLCRQAIAITAEVRGNKT